MKKPLFFIATIGLVVFIASISAFRPVHAQINAGEVRHAQPNILIILADDMGYADTIPYGGEVFTPNIDRLANQGVQFSNFHVSGYCAPTRSILLTGVDHHVTGLGNMVELLADNQFGKPGYEGSLNGRAKTIASILRGAGYHTYMAGKWHLGKTPEKLPAAQGFEESVTLVEGGADNWEKKSYSPGYVTVHFYEGAEEIDLPADFYSTKFYTDKLLGYIDKHASDGKPFFAYLAYQAVHQPHQAPEEFIKRYEQIYQAGWSAIKEMRYHRQMELGLMPAGLKMPPVHGVPDWDALSPEDKRVNAKRMAVYAGMLEYMDMSIGRILKHLEDKNMLDDTVIVFMSDNGGEDNELAKHLPDYYRKNFDLSYERMGLKGSYSEYGPGWASTSGTPFFNFKGTASEGGVRANFVIRYPRQITQGENTDAFAYVSDLAPTLLDLAGVKPVKDKSTAALDGRSMAPMLTGKSKQVYGAHDAVCYELAGSSAVYRGDFKLVRDIPPYGDRQWRLYNLRLDPTESNDLSKAHPDLVKSMLAAYAGYVKKYSVVEVPDDYTVESQFRKNMARSKK